MMLPTFGKKEKKTAMQLKLVRLLPLADTLHSVTVFMLFFIILLISNCLFCTFYEVEHDL